MLGKGGISGVFGRAGAQKGRHCPQHMLTLAKHCPQHFAQHLMLTFVKNCAQLLLLHCAKHSAHSHQTPHHHSAQNATGLIFFLLPSLSSSDGVEVKLN